MHEAIRLAIEGIVAGHGGPFGTVIVKDGQTVDLRPVVVARTSGAEAVVETGLQEGETVVTDGQLRLVPGSQISDKSAADAKVTQ